MRCKETLALKGKTGFCQIQGFARINNSAAVQASVYTLALAFVPAFPISGEEWDVHEKVGRGRSEKSRSWDIQGYM